MMSEHSKAVIGRVPPLSLHAPAISNIYNRRTSLPAVFHGAGRHSPRTTNNNLSPNLGFLKEISEFDMEPPFLSPASSSSSADTSPMLLSPTMRPASARFYRKQRDFSPTESRHVVDEFRRSSYARLTDVPVHNDDYYDDTNDLDEEELKGAPMMGNISNDCMREAGGAATSSPQRSPSGCGSPRQRSILHKHLQQRAKKTSISNGLSNSPRTSVFFQHYRAKKNYSLSQTPEARKKFSNSAGSPRSMRHYRYGRIVEREGDDAAEGAAVDEDDDSEMLRDICARRSNMTSAKISTRSEMRTFTVDANGRILDSDIRTIADGGKIFKPTPIRSHKSRRATCPEIWLSAAEDERSEVTRCLIRIFGCLSVGRKSVAGHLQGSADVVPLDDLVSIVSEELHRLSRTVSFMMNENEIQLEVELATRLRVLNDDQITVYMVVYSVDNRDSFTHAAKILYRLYEHRVKSSIPLILVANKIDLQRRRRVTTMEGKMLAKIYKCSFVEVSSLLSMNIDVLWAETLKKLHKSKEQHDRSLERGFAAASAAAAATSCAVVGGSSRRNLTSRRFMGRILSGTRRFAKSCEELVAKMVAM